MICLERDRYPGKGCCRAGVRKSAAAIATKGRESQRRRCGESTEDVPDSRRRSSDRNAQWQVCHEGSFPANGMPPAVKSEFVAGCPVESHAFGHVTSREKGTADDADLADYCGSICEHPPNPCYLRSTMWRGRGRRSLAGGRTGMGRAAGGREGVQKRIPS